MLPCHFCSSPELLKSDTRLATKKVKELIYHQDPALLELPRTKSPRRPEEQQKMVARISPQSQLTCQSQNTCGIRYMIALGNLTGCYVYFGAFSWKI